MKVNKGSIYLVKASGKRYNKLGDIEKIRSNADSRETAGIQAVHAAKRDGIKAIFIQH